MHAVQQINRIKAGNTIKSGMLSIFLKIHGFFRTHKLLISGMSYASIISDVLTENDLISKYSNVQYSFDLLNASRINSDPVIVKEIFKSLLELVFRSSCENNADPQVELRVKTNNKGSFIQLWHNVSFQQGQHQFDVLDILNKFGEINHTLNNSGAALFQINEGVKKMKGKTSVISNSNGTTITIHLPDLTKYTGNSICFVSRKSNVRT